MKKKLLSLLLALCMLLPAAASAATIQPDLSVSTQVDGQELSGVKVNGETHLFLPASADPDNLFLCFAAEDGSPVTATLTGEMGSASSLAPFDLSQVAGTDGKGRYVLSAQLENGHSFRFYVMQGGGDMPTLYLTSNDPEEDRTWVDTSKKNKAKGSMEMRTAGGETIYSGGLTEIKARGNSTFAHYPKKAYQIKLETKTDLLGIGEKGKTWVLLANYGDATGMHDKLFKDLASELGMPYVVDCDWVNLYYDGQYRGIYLLGEKNSVGSTGVDITDLEEAYEDLNPSYGDDTTEAEGINAYDQIYWYTTGLTEPENITGGWLIEKNHDYIDEACGFFTAQGVGFNAKSPEYAGSEAMAYISEYYQAFEDAAYATDAEGNYTGYNTETGKYYYDYVDLESLVQAFLLQELALNPDGFISSMYFHKDADGMMYCGPIWDQDMTLGTGWSKYISPNVEDYHYLAEALIQIPSFRTAVEEYFTYTFAPAVEELLGSVGKIADYKATLASNAAMNSILWPYVRVGDPANESHLWAEGANYQTVTADMEAWLTKRLAVLEERFAIEVVDTQTSVNELGETVITETRGDGSILETLQQTDGSTQTTLFRTQEAQTNLGKVVTTHCTVTLRTPQGNTQRTEHTEYDVSLKASVSGPVTLPLIIPVNPTDPVTAPAITLHTAGSKAIDVVIPVANATTGTVAITADGQLLTTTPAEEGILVTLSDGDTIRILDKTKAFQDVAATDWEQPAVAYTTARGIFNGISETHFGPDSTATRGMLFTVLARMAGEDTTPDAGENWQQPGLDWAVANGISDGTFPDKSITREQLATMLYRWQGQPEGIGNLEDFADGNTVSDWAAEAMEWAVGEGIYRGNGSGILNPAGTATRAEIAQVIMNFLTR